MDPHLLIAAAEGCDPQPVGALLDHGDPEAILADPPDSLPPRVRRRLADRDALRRQVDRWLTDAHRSGLHVLTPDSVSFPGGLHALETRPRVLFVRGDPRLLGAAGASIGVVGSRTPTPYGLAATEDFVGSLTRAGLVVWSGLAYGIDAAAHRTTLQHAGRTVAVLAGGLDRIYPGRHIDLANQIVKNGGLLVSEAPPGQRARRGHFPRRNRILAAACDAVLVVEAGLTSGSLHTARAAAEVGVAVFAVPGPFRSERSRGCHALVADGAQLAVDPGDLLRRLGIERALAGHDGELETSADQAAILDLLQSGPRPMDLVLRESRLDRERFLRALLTLQAARRVRAMPGDLIGATRPARASR